MNQVIHIGVDNYWQVFTLGVQIGYMFAILSHRKNMSYPVHPLEHAVYNAVRAIIRLEMQSHSPVDDSMKAALEVEQINQFISESKRNYFEVLEMIGVQKDMEHEFQKDWTAFKTLSATTTEINGIAHQNLYFPILRSKLKQWLDELLEHIEQQKRELKIIERCSVSPAEGNRMISEWLDVQQDLREAVVLCVSLLDVNKANAESWEQAQRVGEFYWSGVVDYEQNKQNYYK